MKNNISTGIKKELLFKLMDRLENVKNSTTFSEEQKTKMILVEIGKFKDNLELVNIVHDYTVSENDIISPDYFNELYSAISDMLYDSMRQISRLTTTINSKLEQEYILQDTMLNIEDVIDTKINEIENQVKTKVNKESVNKEMIVSIDFRKNVNINTLDIFNSILILHKTESIRLDSPNILTLLDTDNKPDYNSVTGVFNGKLIANYEYETIEQNNKEYLFDNDLNTNITIQATYDTLPTTKMTINSNSNKFNMIYIISNGNSEVYSSNNKLNNINNVFITDTPTDIANIEITGKATKKETLIPKAVLLDKITNEIVREFTYFKSMKILNAELFNSLFDNDKIFDEDIDIKELNKIGIISQVTDTIPISELIVKDIFIESNKYNNTGIWESGLIDVGNNIISLSIDADVIEYEGTTINIYIQLPEVDSIGWYKLGLYNKPVITTDDGIIPNRIVFKPDYVNKNNGDIIISSNITKMKLRIEMNSNKEYVTPMIGNVNIKFKVLEQ